MQTDRLDNSHITHRMCSSFTLDAYVMEGCLDHCVLRLPDMIGRSTSS